MAKGLPKSIIKKYGISKKAWRVFRGKKKSKSNPRPSKKARKVRSLARRYFRRKRRRGGKSMMQTAFKLIRIGAFAAPGINAAIAQPTLEAKVVEGIKIYTGYDMWAAKWNVADLGRGWGPYIGACLTTYGIPKLVSIIRRL